MNYYLLIQKVNDVGPTAIAYPPKEFSISHELIAKLEDRNELPFDLTFKRVEQSESGLKVSEQVGDLEVWTDYLPNSFVWPFMSDKIRSIIDINLTGEEGISWITAKVKGSHEEKSYNIPRFARKLDVLDFDRTVFAEGTDHIVIPYFSSQKVKPFSLFHTPDNFCRITSDLYVNESVKEAILKDKITGVAFERISLR